MSFQAQIITIFISSPGDVPDDRGLIIRTIDGWNQRNGQSRKVFFQPLTWEQMVPPDRSGSGQEVIDAQIGATYDIYLGLMWSRFGSATRNADSGTEDEFDQAIVRHNTGESLRISFLFKNSDIPQDILDGVQFDKVQKFKKKVADEGCLYREFNDNASLIGAVNIILDRFANGATSEVASGTKKGRGDKGVSPASGDASDLLEVEKQDDELGLFDFNEVLESESERFAQLMSEWSSKIGEVGDRATEATDELNSISRFGQIDPTAAKKIINRVAKFTDSMASWGEDKQQLIDKSMENLAEALSGIWMVSKDFDPSPEDIASGIKAGEGLIATINDANHSLEDLAKTALSMPRVTKEMIGANKRLAAMLDRMISKNKTFVANVKTSVEELNAIYGESALNRS